VPLSDRLETVVIVGASLAGMRAAAALRDDGYTGRIVVIGDETHPPYDRPPLSKQFLAGTWGAERIGLLPKDNLDKLNIDLRQGHSAVRLDIDSHVVEVSDGSQIVYDKAIVATGSHPRMLPGTRTGGPIITLRTIDDSIDLSRRIAQGTRLVVVGGGFIGSEVAATATQMGAEATILEALPAPLSRVLGDEIGAAAANLQIAHGVDVRTSTGVSEIAVSGERAVVQLSDGGSIEADVVVVGIGITPTTAWLADSGLEISDGLVIDEMLYAADDVLAAGDVARWFDKQTGTTRRAEHWTNAAEQGAAAGHNLLAGRRSAEPYRPIPYVWSDQYDIKIQVLGVPRADDTVELVDGSYDGRFVAVYGRDRRLSAAVGFGRPRQLMSFRKLLMEEASFDQAVQALKE
jgi:NADPH-dependent 2,4-dienoyl-CoA reductase/sulfur reductase-like enzyme